MVLAFIIVYSDLSKVLASFMCNVY